jgi:hypothetical protein
MNKIKIFNQNSGIAIDPILFVIAIIAVLAIAIAAGSSTFSSCSDREKAKTYSAYLINDALTIHLGVQYIQAVRLDHWWHIRKFQRQLSRAVIT